MRNLMFVALLLFILHARTDAAPVYTVGLADQGISHTGSGPQTAEFAFQPQDGVSLQEYTSAGGSGGLGTFTHLVIARTVTSGGGGSSLLAVGPANASFALDDIIISGPSSTVNTSVNLSLTGTLTANTSITGQGNSISAAADMSVQGSLENQATFTGDMHAFSASSTETGTTTSFTAAGVFSGASGFPGSLSWTTPSGNLPVGTAFGFNLLLSTDSILGEQVSTIPLSQYAESTADFRHSLGFSSSGPVFNLPDGYTVNSVSGNIVDNHYVGVLAGDYNNNGIVDAADYIVWRKGLGTVFTQNDYNVWRAFFGQPAGSGSGTSVNAAVSEPATSVLLMFAATGWCVRRRRTA